MPGSAYRSRGLVPEIRKDYATPRWTIARSNWCSAHTASGITTSPRTVGSSTSRSSRTMANEPARPTLTRTSDHRDPDRAPLDSRREGGHACTRRAAGGRVLVLRNPRTRAGLRKARHRRERRVRRARAVRGALPVRDVAAPESTRTGIRDALRCGPCGTHGDSERRPRSHGSDARRSVLQLLHSRGPGPEPEGTFHWHLEITPRLTEIAGFERGTGFYINPVVPEDAAAILKGEIRWAAARPSAT